MTNLALHDLELPKYPIVHNLEDKYDYVVAIGDVHGCSEQLEELMNDVVAYINDYPLNAAFILLGDLIDRGPDPEGVYKFIEGWNSVNPNIFCVMGNHSSKHVRYKRYEVQGGKNPMKATEEFTRTHKLMSDEHFKYLASLPSAIQWRGWTFCHAGLDPFLKYNQPLQGFLRNRYFELKDGKWVPSKTWQDKNGVWCHSPTAKHWSELYEGPEKVVYGHEVLPEPRVLEHSIGIDTGCAMGGKLSALIIKADDETLDFVSVPGLQGPDITTADRRDGC